MPFPLGHKGNGWDPLGANGALREGPQAAPGRTRRRGAAYAPLFCAPASACYVANVTALADAKADARAGAQGKSRVFSAVRGQRRFCEDNQRRLSVRAVA